MYHEYELHKYSFFKYTVEQIHSQMSSHPPNQNGNVPDQALCSNAVKSADTGKRPRRQKSMQGGAHCGNGQKGKNRPKSKTSIAAARSTATDEDINFVPKKAPLYITIGPQAAGKTTYLSKLKKLSSDTNNTNNSTNNSTNNNTSNENNNNNNNINNNNHLLKDITIDDQDGVHIPTPIELWLFNDQNAYNRYIRQKTSTSKSDSKSDLDLESKPSSQSPSRAAKSNLLLQPNTIIHGKSISQRIYDDVNNHEMRYVIQRLNNVLSAKEFRQCIYSLYSSLSSSSNSSNNNHGRNHKSNYNNNHNNRNRNHNHNHKNHTSNHHHDMDQKTNAKLRKLLKKEESKSNHHTSTNISNCNWKESLIHAVETMVTRITKANPHNNKNNRKKNETIQLFIVEGIFKDQTPTLSSLLSSLSLLDNETIISNNNNVDGGSSCISSSKNKSDCNHNKSDSIDSIDSDCNLMSGLNAATTKLNHYATNKKYDNMPIAWGNTNTKSRDYGTGLDIAAKSQRAVHFIPYMNKNQLRAISISTSASKRETSVKVELPVQIKSKPSAWTSASASASVKLPAPASTLTSVAVQHTNDDNNINKDEEEGQEEMMKKMYLPNVEMNTLFQRNVERLYSTGRYIPVKAIIDTCYNVDELMDRAMNEMKVQFQQKNKSSSSTSRTRNGPNMNGKNPTTNYTKFQLDFTLAKMAGYHMNDDRTVKRNVIQGSSTYRR
jgi:hypothetical protein